ncbi:hypothetical protein, partial [Actinobacillus pleuropneumoniae]
MNECETAVFLLENLYGNISKIVVVGSVEMSFIVLYPVCFWLSLSVLLLERCYDLGSKKGRIYFAKGAISSPSSPGSL